MTRQEEYAEQEARLIQENEARKTVSDFIESVHGYGYTAVTVQELIAFHRLSYEDQKIVLEVLK